MDFKNKMLQRFNCHYWSLNRKRKYNNNYLEDELPLRSELFSTEQMEQHGKILAKIHKLKQGCPQGGLLERLANNEALLLEVHNLLTDDVKLDIRITPAGEWLLDNFYLIDEQIRTAKRHFPKGYSMELPHLLEGPSAGLPRVYDIALDTISHGDGRVDSENLCSFVASYQSITTLKLGELWAIPIMLRLALIENLRRVAVRIALDRVNRNFAIKWAEQMIIVAVKDPKSLILTISDMARSNPPIVSSFVAELTRRLQGQGPALALPLTWLEQRLTESNQTIEQLVSLENQQQAADQVSISNSIGSLRLLGALDWSEFVEKMSLVEEILCTDPANIYCKMDFATRDLYRHIVEKLAKKSLNSESDIAEKAIKLAKNEICHHEGDFRERHVGYYLIDKGLTKLEHLVKVNFMFHDFIKKIFNDFSFLYSFIILMMTIFLSLLIVTKAESLGLSNWNLVWLGILSFFCFSHLVVALINWIATLFATPRSLPRMDFSKGIPNSECTLVIVPTMLSNTQNIEELVKALEVRFLANQDNNIFFGLLTDFHDANQKTILQDEPLLELVKLRISELNDKYPRIIKNTFFLFHRSRSWNPQEKKWMGYERKRGKLSDLNALLRGGLASKFSLIVGDYTALSNIKYVITLDTDTQLARDSAWQFIGTMAHPLNKAHYDVAKKRIVAGYGILQPRVAVSLSGSNQSHYTRMCANNPGNDPYTRAVSDVYQDMFGEGSFIGKGIYDVDAFEKALGNCFPENRILSHDLLEGCYARSGLLSDVPLYEEYPSTYFEDVLRRHRWIRGDWQIAQWILPVVLGPAGQLQKNPISLLSRWKIYDNLWRSLSAPALTLMLILGWLILPNPLFWTYTVLSIILIPSLINSVVNFFQKPVDVNLKQHLSFCLKTFNKNFFQGLFTLTCLPFEAYFSIDAILRSFWRLYISHKLLLQWNPSDNNSLGKNLSLIISYQKMWITPILSIFIIITLVFKNPVDLFIASPIIILWLFSPLIVFYLNIPIKKHEVKLTNEQFIFLRKLSRKTWSFFETFITEQDNWLPPDNYQEHPVAILAHRTSPTNIGLSLLSNLAAKDFGTISIGKFIDRTSKTLFTMESLERYRGHFYNWYDTLTLIPLKPLYISSVDSGNLAGHLLTLRSGLLELSEHDIISSHVFESLHDTYQIIGDYLVNYSDRALLSCYNELNQKLYNANNSLSFTTDNLYYLISDIIVTTKLVISEVEIRETDPNSLLLWWCKTFLDQCTDALDDLIFMIPWANIINEYDLLKDFYELHEINSLETLAELEFKFSSKIDNILQSSEILEINTWLGKIKHGISVASQRAKTRLSTLKLLALKCESLADMEFDFLYDETRHLLVIGYNVDECRRDSSFYDLLASEARLSTFIAIAQGKLPQESWFALGRLLTTTGGDSILLSWSGSMFEYLMPLLVMPNYEYTLLDQTYKAVVSRQINYGKTRGIPWGISESGYNAIDVHLNYQYRAFGVPGLGLKRGLADDLVIAPYSSVLALMVLPEEACINLERLESEGFSSRYGFYEAIDYTLSRLPHGHSNAIVRSFMAHHQGMSFLALAHLLLNRPMQKRFESNPLFKATLLLLQERIPKATAFYARTTELSEHHTAYISPETSIRVFADPDTPSPEVQLLSNGRYHVMITSAGGGYSFWKDIALTRWHEDRTCDNWGMFCFIRDLDNGEYWSAAYQPTLKKSKYFETIFSEGKVEFRGRENDLDTHMEISVSPEDDIELRRIRISNRTRNCREIDVTSYAEVVLASPVSDALHPAFSNLFVQTEILTRQHAILCTRRPRSEHEQSFWMFHLMAVHGAEIKEVSYETDRMQFIGRGNTIENPITMQLNKDSNLNLSNSEGSVLDPIVAIRYRLILNPEESVNINMVTGIGESRESVLALVDKYQDKHISDRVFDLAWIHGQVLLRQLNASEAEAQMYGRLANSIIFANPSLRADSQILTKNCRGQSGLWGYAISGDLPIVLLRIEDLENIDLVRQLVQAHAYWKLKGLVVDLVIWNEDHAGYRQQLHDQIMGLIAASAEANVTDQPGGIFVRPVDQISEEDRILIQTVARIIISDNRGSLANQISGCIQSELMPPKLIPNRSQIPESNNDSLVLRSDLMFYNGLGGFTPDGKEYIITTMYNKLTPAPWVNILANDKFGSVVSESGLAYTWGDNAHEFRLTPWANDPVSDSRGEAFYLRDDERGQFWSPTPLPCRGKTPYISRHGFGYSVFEHNEFGIRSELWIYVSLDSSIKYSVLKIINESGRPRKISATAYVEWVLGDLRSKSSMHIITEIDNNSNAILAYNKYNSEFCNRVAFFDVDDVNHTFTCDRKEFLGRNGTLQNPISMSRTKLSGKVGAGLDPCASIQVNMELAIGQEREIVFKLGFGQDLNDARSILNKNKGSKVAQKALELVWQYWAHILGSVNVETPDKSLNVLANGWLIYQTLACRLWSRSATYQSGGAYGFRDQLQDSMAMIHSDSSIIRKHILLCASRQFVEGDVQHWWHPPLGRGVRTHCSDDYLWLPVTVCRYVFSTGDEGILDESISFLKGRALYLEEDSYYDLPACSDEKSSLYDHCVRAISKSLVFGSHGLPLIGSGDWNDGMNLVGELGKGESVWLGFFLYDTLVNFSEIARKHDDILFAKKCSRSAVELRSNLEINGWDGEWYKRAYFDNGIPLGSSVNIECQIDSISQSWSVLSGAGDLLRSQIAMESLDKKLVNRKSKIIQLLDPPFDKSDLNPGYIKGYVPGVRENGGQYTHAAIWATMAYARLGDQQHAWEMFSMINPVNHSKSYEDSYIYKVEPYVMSADIYALPPHTGRGGWTWYTGSAAWMYRLITESLLGLKLEVDKLYILPCLPIEWKGYKIHYRFHETVYHISVIQIISHKIETQLSVDGNEQTDKFIHLVDDNQEHWAEFKIHLTDD